MFDAVVARIAALLELSGQAAGVAVSYQASKLLTRL
jgi:hypothetical protein